MSEPIPTRAALLQALKEDLESFVFVTENMGNYLMTRACIDCLTDAIARISDMLNSENARVMGEEKK